MKFIGLNFFGFIFFMRLTIVFDVLLMIYLFKFLAKLNEKTEEFYNQIYTGQKVSFGKTHKDYQG